MADRFEMGQARCGILAGLQPLIDGALGITGCGQMMRQQFGLALDEVEELLFEHRGHPGVQFLPPCPQQSPVGGVLHQCMLEQVGGVRGDAATEQQPGLREPVEPGPQLDVGPLRHRVDQIVAELAAEHGTDLPNLFGDSAEPVEPRDQRGMQGGRYRKGGRRARRQHGVAVAALKHRLGQLFDEERHAAVRSAISSTICLPSVVFPASLRTRAATSRSPSRFSASIVTCDWQLHAC